MRAWWLCLASASALMGLQAAAWGYCLNKPQNLNKYVSWQSIPVTYRVSDNLKDAGILAAIDAAFKTWQDVKCSTLAFTKGSPFKMCTVKDKTKCPSGTVHFDHETSYIFIFWHDSTNASAFPISDQYSSYNYLWFGLIGSIDGASLAVNAFKYKWNATGGDKSGIFDVQNEMTAMIGSVIGLKDSKTPGATMYPQTAYGDTSKQTLAQDDIDGAGLPLQGQDMPGATPTGCQRVLHRKSHERRRWRWRWNDPIRWQGSGARRHGNDRGGGLGRWPRNHGRDRKWFGG